MGMAASQCRMLALTSQMSDLELRAQFISNTKMILSRRLSDVTKRYTEKIANQQLFIRTADTGVGGTGTITTSNLTSTNFFKEYGIQVGTESFFKGAAASFERRFNDGKVVSGEGVDNNILQYLLTTGQALIIKYESTVNATGEEVETTSRVTPSELSAITETYYTGDDGVAEAEYNQKTREIEAKEEQLDLELDTVNNQHEAAKTEYDSVKTIIKDNIGRTFKYFG